MSGRLNPEGAPKVTGWDVRKFAHGYSVSVKRNFCMWFYTSRNGDGEWIAIGATNYLALQTLKGLAKRGKL